MRLSSLLPLLAFAAVSTAARADTLETFTFSNISFASGATGSGTVTIDVSAGTYTGVDFVYKLGSGSPLSFTEITRNATSFDQGKQVFSDFYDGVGDYLALDIMRSNLVGYAGGPICSQSLLCDGYLGGFGTASAITDDFKTGSLALSPVLPAVPEPSSLVLLATGLLTAAAARRRMPATR